ncbi:MULTISPECIES: ATPase [unclassified Clostridium]|uniref:ATPase n=1 Tax=unclassified Clostridium TaxID=2614128 RepID=UPI000EBAE9A6|nr:MULTISPECIES: ATPase [unclassified Clostridium]HCQ89143.1 ATPase [Clostridium sp.]
MALEAINKVKTAEDQAAQALEKALKESKDIIKNAEREADKQYEARLTEAYKEAEQIKSKFISESEVESEPIMKKGKEEVDHILNVDANKFNSAVKLVIERIVNFNGNS